MYHSYFAQIQKNLNSIPDNQLFKKSCCNLDTDAFSIHTETIPHGKGRILSWRILPEITLSFQDYLTEQISCRHKADHAIMEINYCRHGRIGWNMQNGQSIYMGSGDFSVHTRQLCADSVMTLPNGYFQGLTLSINLAAFQNAPSSFLSQTGITAQMLCEKYCTHGTFTTFTENQLTKAIFNGFYHYAEPLRRPYFIIKTLELLLYLCEAETDAEKETGRYRSEQVKTIHEIHEYILQHMDQKITIEELSRQYLMNPTTLKTVFKAVYGNSLASHMKEHRMEKAAFLLRETTDSIASISQTVGYNSQSRFSTAFKDTYRLLPLEYRKLHSESCR